MVVKETIDIYVAVRKYLDVYDKMSDSSKKNSKEIDTIEMVNHPFIIVQLNIINKLLSSLYPFIKPIEKH